MSDTSKDIQKAITSLKRFVSILKKGQNISLSFYKSLHENPHIPSKIKKQIKQVIKQTGGTTQISLRKFACGGGGCVYEIKPSNTSEYDKTTLYKIMYPPPDDAEKERKLEIQKQMIDNIDLVLSSLTTKEVLNFCTFKKYTLKINGNSETTITTYDPYGYFVLKCDGDLDKLDVYKNTFEEPYGEMNNVTIITLENTLQIINEMNKMGIVHGDIKLPNIMFKYDLLKIPASYTYTIYPNVYLHDFDDIFRFKTELYPLDRLSLLNPSFSPLYAAPIYIHYRNCIKNMSNEIVHHGISAFHSSFTQSYMLTGLLNALVPDPIKHVFIEIVKQRDMMLNFIYNMQEPKTSLTPPHYQNFLNHVNENLHSKQLLLYHSDVYALGASCIHKSMSLKINNPALSKVYFGFGLKCFYQHFSIPKNLNGGMGSTTLQQPTTNLPTHTPGPKPEIQTIDQYISVMSEAFIDDKTVEFRDDNYEKHKNIKCSLDGDYMEYLSNPTARPFSLSLAPNPQNAKTDIEIDLTENLFKK